MTWWAWMILGAVLFGAEMFAIDAQFYLVFLGLSAALVGLAGLLGLTLPEWGQWLLFAGLSLITMFTFRRSLYDKIRGDVPGFREGVEGEFLVISQELPAGAQGRASFRGSDWTIVNDGSAGIAAGTRARISRSEGLTLYVSVDPQ
ncbi:MAG: NfeD family protein [Gammaproteobacteria bacterium]|nr:NfeD family protein [Gammaproteobacteria bacterium]MDH4316184.1 NfeD family protein [Gammaproteobacteria bacterium]